MNRIACCLLSLGFALPLTTTAQEFCNTTPITVPGTGTAGPANPYPATIVVTGGPASISSVVVSLYGASHTFSSDLDLLLVSPGGQRLVLQSDVGGATDLSGTSYAISDSAGQPFTGAQIASAYYRPTNLTGGDTFPAPAPPGPYAEPAPAASATLAGTFNGTSADGIWGLYIADDVTGDIGSVSGGWCLRFSDPLLRISEFRLRGPNGAFDEFVELQNIGAAPITVDDIGSGSGFAIAASDGTVRCVLPNGTVIPPARHVLCANSLGYSLADAPGNQAGTPADIPFTTDIPDNFGIAVFATTESARFVLGNRLDAVGAATVANPLYREGAGYPALTPFSINYAFHRDTCGKLGNIVDGQLCAHQGLTVENDDNATDFVFVDTNGTSAGAGQRLGAPGPENAASPFFGTGTIASTFLDGCADERLAPNADHDPTSVPAENSTFGTLVVRRSFTNRTGTPLTRLRFRIIDLTTFPAPLGTADLRPKNAAGSVVARDAPTCGGSTSNVTVLGTTLEQPPAQPNGGGFNSALSVPGVSAATPLANNATVNVEFRFGVQQNGNFRAAMVAEGLPRGGGPGEMAVAYGCVPIACPAAIFSDGLE